MDALAAASSAEDPKEREVYVPEDMTFHMMPVWGSDMSNMTIMIDGTIKASKRQLMWPIHHWNEPTDPWSELRVRDLFSFSNVHNFKFVGKGTIDGQGYMWWVREYLGLNGFKRPHLLSINKSTNVEVAGVRFLNSPSFHVSVYEFDGAYIHDFEIHVDVKG
jgi:polygalacturonase